MPMHLPRRDMHHIADLQALGLLALGADKSRAHGDGEDLAALVVVPVSAGAGREADVVAHAICCVDCDRLSVDWLIEWGVYRLMRD